MYKKLSNFVLLYIQFALSLYPKYLIDPGNMHGRLPEGFHHIQKNAVEGIDILIGEIDKL